MAIFTSIATAIVGAVIGAGVVATTIGTIVGAIGSAFVLGAASRFLAPKPKQPGNIASSAAERTVNVRQPIVPRSLIYGQIKVGGAILFAQTSADNQRLNLVIALAGHEVAEIGAIYFNDEVVPVNPDGSVQGRFAGRAFIYKHLGAADQAANAQLIANSSGKWTAAHRLQGIAYLYVTLIFNAAIFGAIGIPTITAMVKGKKVYDPRSGLTVWSDNPALALADYLTDAKFGLGANYAAEIDQTALIAAANACDEFVNLAAQPVTVLADPVTDILGLLEPGAHVLSLAQLTGVTPPPPKPEPPKARLLTGTRVRFTSPGALPGGLSAGVDYYWIYLTPVTGRLASSLANARAGAAIDLTTAGTGVHTGHRQAEPRFTANGLIETDRTPKENIGELLTAIGGHLVMAGGKWGIYPAVYRAPTVTLTEADARGPLNVQTLVSRRENFNAVKGVFVDPSSNWQPTDFPSVKNDAYLAQDGYERAWKDVSLPFTLSANQAQRLAKIELERARQPITLSMPCKLTAFRLGVPDVVQVTNARMGWTAKPFEVRGWTFQVYDDDQGAPALVVDLNLRETASAVFDWAAGEETKLDPAPNTNLPDPFTVQAPTSLTVAEELYVTRAGDGVKAKAILTWGASPDAFVREYQIEFKLTSATDYTVAGRTTQVTFEVLDLAPGFYDFRVQAINSLQVVSAYASQRTEIFGLLAPPAAPQNLTISAIGGLAILRWDQSPDLDVRMGGKIVFRHSPALTGASWAGAISIGNAMPGSSTVAVLPLAAGTYLARAEDSSGVQSTATSSVSSKQASVLAYANVTTISEDPDFTGVHADTMAGGGILKLGLIGGSLVDSWADLEAIANIDTEGGAVTAAEGTYTFAAGIDRGAVSRTRLTAVINALTVSVNDAMDSWTGNLDDRESFDGADSGSADARVFVRSTDDNPAGSPTWGPWQRLDSAEFQARAFQFQARLSSSNPAYNIEISGLDIVADQLA